MTTFKTLVAVACGMIGFGGMAQAQSPTTKSAQAQANKLLDEGKKLVAEKDYEGAVLKFELALVFDHKSVPVLTEYAGAMNKLGKHPEAQSLATIALLLDGTSGKAKRELGIAAAEAGDQLVATVALFAAIKHDQFDFDAYDHLTKVLKAQGQKEAADMTKAMKAMMLELKQEVDKTSEKPGERENPFNRPLKTKKED